MKSEAESIREQLDRSQSGAPAAGEAVRDIFSTDEIFHRIVATAEEDFNQSLRLLFLSGLAAGLSIGLSFVARAALTGAVPSDTSGLVGNILYPLGFLLIVLGRYQLFTENTLTPVTQVLTRIGSIPTLLRIWGCVLTANVIGASALAFVLANTGILTPEAAEAARSFGKHALEVPWGDLFWKGVLAGWIVASMVWLNHATRNDNARFFIVFTLMYLIPSADLFHCIIGACEVLFLIFQGLAEWSQFVYFFSAVMLGNTVGGVILVAILNYSQTRKERFPNFEDCGQLELTWNEWLFGRHNVVSDFFDDTGEMPKAKSNLELEHPVHERDHSLGATGAPITVLQYGDYECTTSARIYRMVEEILQERDDVRYVYRHLPLSRTNCRGEHAAMAAETAADQGKFWEMHRELFENQNHLEDESLIKYAERTGFDPRNFGTEMMTEEHRKRVLRDRRSGVRCGVEGMENLFINGRRYTKDMNTATLQKEIDRVKMMSEG